MNKVFKKIEVARITFIILEFGMIYFILKENTYVALLFNSAIVILFVTLFMNLWEALNKERLNK